MANLDPVLSDIVEPNSTKNRLTIEVNDKIVGFMTPRKDGDYWQTRAIYILPEYQKQGIVSEAIQLYFKDKTRAKALVSLTNDASYQAYLKNGFKVEKIITHDNEDFRVMIK